MNSNHNCHPWEVSIEMLIFCPGSRWLCIILVTYPEVSCWAFKNYNDKVVFAMNTRKHDWRRRISTWAAKPSPYIELLCWRQGLLDMRCVSPQKFILRRVRLTILTRLTKIRVLTSSSSPLTQQIYQLRLFTEGKNGSKLHVHSMQR